MTDIPHLTHEEVTETQASAGVYKLSYNDDSSKASPIWLISFTDLMGIILTVFVLMYTMSSQTIVGTSANPDEIKPLQDRGQAAGAPENPGPLDAISLNKIDFNRSVDLGYLYDVLQTMTDDTPILQKANLVVDASNKRLILTLPQDLLFEKGKAELSAEGYKAVVAMAAILKNIKNGIEIVGHADPSVATKGGADNWDISLTRALAVARVMNSEGYTRELPVKGYASGLYDSLPSSMPEAKRQALSRRVDIIINTHDGSAQQRFGIGPQ